MNAAMNTEIKTLRSEILSFCDEDTTDTYMRAAILGAEEILSDENASLDALERAVYALTEANHQAWLTAHE